MLFVYITLFGLAVIALGMLSKPDNDEERKGKQGMIAIGIFIAVCGSISTYLWNPRDFFSTPESLQKKATYNQVYKECSKIVGSSGELMGYNSRSVGWAYGTAVACDNMAKEKSGYKGEEKSLFAFFSKT